MLSDFGCLLERHLDGRLSYSPILAILARSLVMIDYQWSSYNIETRIIKKTFSIGGVCWDELKSMQTSS